MILHQYKLVTLNLQTKASTVEMITTTKEIPKFTQHGIWYKYSAYKIAQFNVKDK